MRHWFKWFVYVSLLFLVWYLAREGLLAVPTIHSPSALVISLAFLVSGFLAGPLAWKAILSKSGYPARFAECTASMGLTVFGKYIPGKLWVVLGRAAYVAGRRAYPLTAISAVSLSDQFIALWVGLVLGAVGLLWIGGLRLYGWLVLVSWILLSLLVFGTWCQKLVERLLRAWLRSEITIPTLRLRSTLSVLPWFLGYWLLWSVGFYFLAVALVPGDPSPSTGLVFSLAASLGIMAIIVPGGLGVREGILAACLVMTGLSAAEATTLSVASRLWFVIGEVSLFACGVIADRGVTAPPASRGRG